MEWWQQVQEFGFKFNPTEVELILAYLYPKVRGRSGPGDLIGLSDQVYTKPPWELCTDLTAFPGNGKYYFFTELKKNNNRVARTVGSYGTWQGKSKSKEIFAPDNVSIGVHRVFYFREKCEGKEIKTDWSMHEFSLPGNESNLVLCVIQKKEEMGPVPVSFLDLYHTTSAGGDLCPAPAHDDHFQLQALDSEEPETWRSHLDEQSGFPNDLLIFPSVPGYPNYRFL